MNKKIIKTVLLSLIVMALWGSLFPFIKIGYSAFSIDSTNIPSILMFAGTRFIVCGIIISLVTLLKNRFSKGTPAHFPKGKAILEILLIGLFTIILHYSLLYIGISITDSSKTAIIKQLGSLFYVCLAFLFIKNEKDIYSHRIFSRFNASPRKCLLLHQAYIQSARRYLES